MIVIEDHSSNDSGCSAGSDSAANSPTDIDVDDAEETLIEVLPQSPEKLVQSVTENNEFSQFQYWRVPIPDIELDLSLIDQKSNNTSNESQTSNATEEQTIEPKPEVTEDSSALTSYDELGTNLCDDQKRLKEGQPLLTIDAVGATVKSEVSDKREWKSSDWNYNFSNITYSDFVSIREPTLNFYSQKNDSDDIMSYTFGDSLPMGSGYMFPCRRTPPSQDIIPNELLENYLSMTNPIHYQSIDPDLCHHCAYSLPAVALTLGRQNWPCLRETYEGLAADMQWKVRWTLASSLHQMSQILGSELTTRDLLPIFLAFMKDLDEVRFGILQNLAAFLKLLLRPQQQGILPKISEFLKMDNNRNWRFRHTLAEQIIDLAEIYTSSEIKEYLYPIALVLLNDKGMLCFVLKQYFLLNASNRWTVCEVRLVAIRLMSVLMKSIFILSPYSTNSSIASKLDIIDELNSQMAESGKWVQRQAYVMACEQIIANHSVPFDVFIDKMLDHLLNLSEDKVPNIRLVVARTISQTLWPIGMYFLVNYEKSILTHVFSLLSSVQISSESATNSGRPADG